MRFRPASLAAAQDSNATESDFFDDAASVSYPHLINVLRRGFPTVAIESEFTAPLQYGDIALVKISIGKIGRSSATFNYEIRRKQDSRLCFSAQITKSGFFQQLRTEQQLGYVVSALYWPQYDVPALGFVIQSPSASAPEVATAIESFLRGTLEGELAITGEQFGRHKLALVNEIMQPHKNIWEESEYFWDAIAKRELDFDSRQRLVEAVEAISFEAWQAWFQEHMVAAPAAVPVTTAGRWGERPEGSVVEGAADLQKQRGSYTVD